MRNNGVKNMSSITGAGLQTMRFNYRTGDCKSARPQKGALATRGYGADKAPLLLYRERNENIFMDLTAPIFYAPQI